MKTQHIEAFVAATGFKFLDSGEIGFGRHCVGIVNTKTDSYVSYETYSSDTWQRGLIHEVAEGTKPEGAYHKGPYLAILFDGTEEGRVKAISDLNDWVEKIVVAGYELTEYTEKNSIASLMNGGSVTQICLTGGITLGKFLEVF